MHTAVEGYSILRANRKLCEMLGYTHDELLRMTSTDIVHPDYRFIDRPRYKNQLIKDEVPAFSSERKFLRKDGTSIWVNRTVSLVHDAAGRPLYFIRIIEDITERKQAESALRASELKYRSVIAVMAEGVFLRDAEGRIVTCNASAERIIGRSLDQLRGNFYFDPSWQAIREDGSKFPDNERPATAALRTGKAQSDRRGALADDECAAAFRRAGCKTDRCRQHDHRHHAAQTGGTAANDGAPGDPSPVGSRVARGNRATHHPDDSRDDRLRVRRMLAMGREPPGKSMRSDLGPALGRGGRISGR
jgi:PAS domain S-box-containing protein